MAEVLPVHQRVVRPARVDDLQALIALYAAVGFSDPAAADERDGIWAETLSCAALLVGVMAVDDAIVASATVITAPNILRGGRRHGFLENVATHPDWQGMGCGSAVVRYVLESAWATGCHHVLMQSGRGHSRVHRFYESVGFVPGMRTGYVAIRPVATGSR